ncbi:MAG: AraC family transcriptional regulator [Rikenellaceae bacterium]
MNESFAYNNATSTLNSDNYILNNSNDQFGFRYRVVTTSLKPEEQLAHMNTVTYNAIFFQLDGELHINWDRHKDVVIRPGDIYFLPRGANVSACTIGGGISYVVARLEHNIDSTIFNEQLKIKSNITPSAYIFAPLPIRPPMMRFVESMKNYIIEGADCAQLHSIKLIELYIIFRRYYTTDECANLFHPIIGHNSKFETFILDNYHMSVSIEDLVQKAKMSRSTFDRKFKDTFKITPLKWIDEQTRQRIFSKASEPNVTIKDIMYEVDIYSHSQFTNLCKRLCGMSPSQLIRIR